MHRVIAIDPGIYGAFTWATYNDSAEIQDAGGCSLPFYKIRPNPNKVIDATRLAYMLGGVPRPNSLIVEEPMMAAHNRSRNAKGVRRSLENYGRILAAIEFARDDDYMIALPHVWKRVLGLSSDKSESIKMARNLFPMMVYSLDVDGLNPTQQRYKYADGVAESLLLGYYAACQLIIGDESIII